MRREHALGAALLCAAVVAAVLTGATAASAVDSSLEEALGVSVGPLPAWAEPLEDVTANSTGIANGEGTAYLVYHRQYMLDGDHLERTAHVAIKVLNTAGLQRMTQVDLDFDPSYQSLTLHFIRVRRGDDVSDRLDLPDLRVMQREQELERRIYDGTRTAVQFLGDVRVGDIVEYAYTLTGMNPVYSGRFTVGLSTGFGISVDHLRYRLLVRDGREIRIRNHGTDIEVRKVVNPDGVEWSWTLEHVEAIESEDHVPGWFETSPWVQISDFGSWGEVVEWALGLYRPRRTAGAAVAEAVRTCADAGSREDQALCAIRFVQDEVRYLGLELGPNSHQPHDPEEVVNHRFGDCKDKSLLLVVLLRQLGFDAKPALVSTTHGRELESRLPTPDTFDHVIVKLRAPTTTGPRTFFVDATQSLQGGDLATMVSPNFERCLVVDQGVGALEVMQGSGTRSSEHVLETFTVKPDGSADLMVSTVSTGSEADATRVDRADTSIADLQRGYLNFYAQDFPGIETNGELELKDDRRANRFETVEHYAIPTFWEDGERTVSAHLILDRAPTAPRTRLRSCPLSVESPLDLEHVIAFNLPFDPTAEPDEHSVDSDVFLYRYRCKVTGRKVEASFNFRSLEDAVPPEKLDAYLESLDEARSHLRFRIFRRGGAAGPAISPAHALGGAGALLGTGICLLGLAVAVRAGKLAWRRRRFRSLAQARLGTSPDVPMDVVSEDAARERLSAQPCTCGERTSDGESEQDVVILGGQRVHVLTQRCSSCGTERWLYFRLPGG